VRRAGVLLCWVVACGARTDLGGASRLAAEHDGDAGDAHDAEAGPPPSPCVATEPVVLASGGKEIQFVALDDANVYWTDFALGTVGVVPKAGGAAGVVAPARGKPSGLAARGGTVYWTEFGGDLVASAAASGGDVTTIASNQDGAYDVALADDGALYWTTFRGCTVSSLLDGASAQLDHASQPFTRIVNAGSLVFWISFEKKSVERYDAASHARATLVKGGTTPPFAIATDGARLYFAETSASDATIASIPVDGGPITTIFTEPCASDGGLVGECLASLATDGDFVYFTSASAVRKVPVAGGDAALVADHQTRAFSIAVDDRCVYWSDLADGTVWAAPKNVQ